MFPRIYETRYGDQNDPKFTEADATINSYVLRRVCREVVGLEFRRNNNSFATGRTWRIRIEDIHDNEKEPHYILDFGECGETFSEVEPLEVAYCDYYSAKADYIQQAPGKFKIYVFGDFGRHKTRDVEKYVAEIYAHALDKFLPNYFIEIDRNAYA